MGFIHTIGFNHTTDLLQVIVVGKANINKIQETAIIEILETISKKRNGGE